MADREYPDMDAEDSGVAAPCPYCTGRHRGKCHLVRAIDYYENGSLRRVEFYSPGEIASASTAAIVRPGDDVNRRTRE